MISMIPLLPVLLFIIGYAWLFFKVQPISTIRAGFEACTVFLLGYAVSGTLLASAGWYDHYLASMILLLCLALLSLLPLKGKLLGSGAIVTEDRKTLFLIMGLVGWTLLLVWTRMEYIEMYSDPGVYINYAKNLVVTGGSSYQPPIPEWILENREAGLNRHAYERPARYLPGIPCQEPFVESSCHYRFLPGWPSVLALGASVFGIVHLHYIMVPISVLVVFWIFWISRRWMSQVRAAGVAAAFTILPVFVYFSKFPTTEVFLLLCVLFLVEAFQRDSARTAWLALLPFGALVVTHISLFLYLPVLFVYGGYIALSSRRTEAILFIAICVMYAVSLPLARYISPRYVEQVFDRVVGTRLPISGEQAPAILAIGVILFAGCVLATRFIITRKERHGQAA